jgi:hypothetical protein
MRSRLGDTRFVLVLASMVSLTGCKESYPKVSGRVYRNGHPVYTGSIQFIPDRNRNNDGPIVTMRVLAGAFSSAEESYVMPISPGPNTVQIIAPGVPNTGSPLSGPPREIRVYDVHVPSEGKCDFVFDLRSALSKTTSVSCCKAE